VIGIGLAMFQQITGINTVIYFAPTIFQSAGMSSAATSILATAGVGAVNVIMTIVSIRLIDRLGRRQLLFWSLGGWRVRIGADRDGLIRGQRQRRRARAHARDGCQSKEGEERTAHESLVI